jgi:hypothetical protein
MWMSAPPLFLFAKPQASIKQKIPILSTGDDARNLSDRSTPLICPTGKSANSCPAPFEKIFLFRSNANHFTNIPVSSHSRGVSRSSRTRGGMWWTQLALLTNSADADGEVVWS